jgi:SSS family solute:Na+ symporter
MIISVAAFLGFYLPIHYFGGMSKMFEALNTAKPGFLAFAAHGHSLSWFVSTTLLTALGFFMWPHSFGSIFTARNAAVFRKNAIILPLYQLVMLFVLLVGFTATLVVPGLKGAVLTALVPGSLIMMSASTVFSRNIVGALRGGQSNEATVQLAKFLVPVAAIVGCYFAIVGSSTIVALLLMGYNFVTQLFPVLICSLMRRNPATKEGAFAGIIAGVATVVYFTLAHQTLGKLLPGLPEVVQDINVGFVALFANVAAIAVVSAVTAGRRMALVKQGAQ